MGSIQQSDYLAMLSRLEKNLVREVPADACENEVGKGGLHEQILAEVKRRGWFALHSRTDKPSTVNCGAPDFVLAADGGKVWWIECKSRTGKLSTDQLSTIALLRHLGHETHVIRSFSEFLALVNQPTKGNQCQ